MLPERDSAGFSWQRSPEASALFNPVLTSELIVTACYWRDQTDGQGIDWPALFLILPIALHPETREAMPRDARITLAKFAVRQGSLVAELDARVTTMADATRRGIRHGLRTGRLQLDRSTMHSTVRPKAPQPSWPNELSASAKAAKMYGRWLAGVETHEALELLGIGL